MIIFENQNDLQLYLQNEGINKKIGFIPTMGALHDGHISLIKESSKKCDLTICSIFINPTQFNNKKDYKTYPRNLKNDLKVLKKLKVDFVFLPSVTQIYKDVEKTKISLNKSEKILCAKFRNGHFEGVLNVLDQFVKLISPKIIFMGEKDYQQFFLVKKFIEKKYKSKVHLSKTIRNSNKVALSSRNGLLNQANLETIGLITNRLFNLKNSINKNKDKSNILIRNLKKELVKKFDIKIEYLECRNLNNMSTNLNKKPYKLFVAYYFKNVRLIDNY